SPNKLVNNDHGNYVFATFTGHIYDPVLDIYFAEARFYDAINRTWMAMDPIKDGLNWYQYCFCNPTTYWDLTGLFAITGASYEYFPILDGSGNLMLNTTMALYQRRLERNIGLLLSAPLTDEYRTQLQLQNQELLEAWLELRGDAIRIVNNQKESSSSKNDPYADVEFGHPIHRGDYLQRDITDLHVADRAARIIFHEDTLPAGQDAIAWTIFNRAMNADAYADPDMPDTLEGVLMSDSGGVGGYQVFLDRFNHSPSAPNAFNPIEYIEQYPHIYTTGVDTQDAWDHAVELGKTLDTISNDPTLSVEEKRDLFAQKVPWPFEEVRPTDGSEWQITYYKSVPDTSETYSNYPFSLPGTHNIFGYTP
ncbi:RHS repeat-associated core domain-containing protein, partial [Allofournierella massiliensis]